MQRTKISYFKHVKSNYILFLLPFVTDNKPNNVLRCLQHAVVPSLLFQVQSPV